MVEFRDVIKRYASNGEAVGVEADEVGGLPVVQEVVAGANVVVDDTDPARPVISATGSGGGGGAVVSVNGQTGVVVLDYNDVGAASAAQGSLAESAVQPGALADVATSGAYSDLSGTPTLGTAAAADTEDFATAEQGEKADTAVQPAALASGLAGKQDADPALDALSGADVEAWGRSWLDLASQADARSRLGLGTAAEMSPVDVVTDSTAQASLSSTFVRHVRWTDSAWPARPPDAAFVIFVSTHDPSATVPDDLNLAAGDVWLQAPA